MAKCPQPKAHTVFEEQFGDRMIWRESTASLRRFRLNQHRQNNVTPIENDVNIIRKNITII